MSVYLSAVIGYVGIGLFLWMYVIGTRAVAGLYFKDLAHGLRIHRWLGKYGTLLVFLHPLLIAYYYGENVIRYTFFPDISTDFQQGVTFGRIAIFALIIIFTTSVLLRKHIAYRPWKYIHYLAYLVVPLGLLHARDVGTSVARPSLQAVWYTAAFVFIVISVLRLRHVFGFGKFAYRITGNRRLTEDGYLLRLKPLRKHIAPQSGQYVYVQQGLSSEEHPFTVVDCDADNLTILYKVTGGSTKQLASRRVGDLIYIDGPYGRFTAELNETSGRPVVFIAGGIGITPFVRPLLHGSAVHYLFYANRTRRSAAIVPALRKAVGNRMVELYSRDPEAAGINVEHGRFTRKLLAAYVPEHDKAEYYVCGPKEMMDGVTSELKAAGINPARIHTEAFEF